jgi:hypothetical protein
VIEILFLLHLAMLFALFLLLQRKVGRIIALVFFVYMTAFTVMKPALLYYFDLYFPYSTNEYSAVVAMQWGSLLFLCILYIAVRFFSGYQPGRYLLHWFDVSAATPLAIWLTFIVFMGISFAGSVIKFADVGYLWSSANTFDATMEQANGSWYIVYVAESLLYGAILVMAFYCSRLPPAKSFALLIFILVVTSIWARLSARSGVLVLLIAWLSCSLSTARQRNLKLIYIGFFGYFLLVLLYVGNYARLGTLADIDVSTATLGAAVAAVTDLSPVDNSALLYSDMQNHEDTDFLPLAGAITPLVLIPSALLPIKIPADKDSQLTQMFFPGGIDTRFYREGGTLTFTVPGSGYADAGYVGVFVASVVYAAMFCIFVAIYRRGSPSAKFVAAVSLLVHIVGYRLSAESLLIAFYTTLLFMGGARLLALLLSQATTPNRRAVLVSTQT